MRWFRRCATNQDLKRLIVANALSIQQLRNETMAQIDDLKAAVAANTDKVNQLIALANNGTGPDLQPEIDAVNATNTALDTAIAAHTPPAA